QHHEKEIREILHNREKELRKLHEVIQEYPIQHNRIEHFLQERRAIFEYAHPDAVKHLSELLKKIRNNMFHAVKDWQEEAEQKLVSTINPILEDILSKLTSS